ncbi:MAG: WxcM-like domain-containing protein [Clostridia bacterium]
MIIPTININSFVRGNIFVDDRGILRFVNNFSFVDAKIKRFYQVENHERGFIRAWHGHKKEEKYVYVAKGSAIIGLINMIDPSIIGKCVLSDKNPEILYIASGTYNGFKTLEEGTILFFFSTTTVEESKGDDYRLPYEDFPIFNIEYR